MNTRLVVNVPFVRLEHLRNSLAKAKAVLKTGAKFAPADALRPSQARQKTVSSPALTGNILHWENVASHVPKLRAVANGVAHMLYKRERR